MKSTRYVHCLATALLSASCALVGCSDSDSSNTTPERGTEGKACFTDGTCATGLSCLAGACVKAGDASVDGAAGDAAGSSDAGDSGTDSFSQDAAEAATDSAVDAAVDAAADAADATDASLDTSLDTAADVVPDVAVDTAVGADAADASDAQCTPTATLPISRSRAKMLFAVDRSSSMACNAPPIQTTEQCAAKLTKAVAAEPSKWEIGREGLRSMIFPLEMAVPTPAVGMLLFNDNGACGFPLNPQVSVAPLSGDPNQDPQLNSVAGALISVKLAGDSPIGGALVRGFAHLHGLKDNPPGNRMVVLLTDGTDTCDPSGKDAVLDQVKVARGLGIRTFVLGVPGSEVDRSFLSSIAFWGGTASNEGCSHGNADPKVGDCHMDMTYGNMDFATELGKNLSKIAGEVDQCLFDAPTTDAGTWNPDLANVSMALGGGDAKLVQRDDTRACDDPSNKGWQFSPDKAQVILCGSACQEWKSLKYATVSVSLGCPTQHAAK